MMKAAQKSKNVQWGFNSGPPKPLSRILAVPLAVSLYPLHVSDLLRNLHFEPGTASPSFPPTMSSPKASPSACASASRSEPPIEPTMEGIQEMSPPPTEILSVIDSFKKQVAADRCLYIKKRMEENRLKLVDVSKYLYKLSLERRTDKVIGTDKNIDLLTKRQKDAIDMQNGIDINNGDKDSSSSQEDGHTSSAILLGSSIAVKNAVRPIKLTEVKRLPPYTTWIFLDRNQRMTEDQSVVGRRRIYYDQNGGEALICSDSEEEIIEDEEEKKEFGDWEDYVLRLVYLNCLMQFIRSVFFVIYILIILSTIV
ncbi:hypothetical protein U1Q18_039241 [Sarracenia purpurea var. burkii]